MTTKRDCISCHFCPGNPELDPCQNCWKYREWKPAEKREIKRRINHLQKILKEVYLE